MISRQLLREIFLLWQQGADGQRNLGECDICHTGGVPNRRVGKKYWICARCTAGFGVWERQEIDAKAAAKEAAAQELAAVAAHKEAAATLMQFSQQPPSDE
jgi:ribosomal protein L37AE/L43A